HVVPPTRRHIIIPVSHSMCNEASPYVLSPLDTLQVTVPDLAVRAFHLHVRDPPGGVAHRPERPPRGHFHGSGVVVTPVEGTDPAVVRQNVRPSLDVCRRAEHAVQGRMDDELVDGPLSALSCQRSATPWLRAAGC